MRKECLKIPQLLDHVLWTSRMALVLSCLNIPHAIAHQAKLSKPHSTKL
jgi:hypothetical protein